MKKSKKPYQYLKVVNLNVERGKYKKCMICQKDFGLMHKEHQCKRCLRAVCEKCSPNKASILQFDQPLQQPHRQCNFCKEECTEMKNFVEQHQIQFNRDTFSLEWLQNFDLDLEIALEDYKLSKQESKNSKKDLSEYNLMKGQIQSVFLELITYSNYSLKEFFALVLKSESQQIMNVLERVVGTFLLNYPQVGYSADLVFVAFFLLCFSSESVAYSLITLIYQNVIPPHLYFRSLRLGNYSFNAEIQTVKNVLEKLKGGNQMNDFLEKSLPRYLLTLSLNFFMFETSFFLISQMFLKPQSAYEEFLKSLASAFSMKQGDEGEIFILRNVKASSVQQLYFVTQKISIDIRNERTDSIVSKKSIREQHKTIKDHDILKQQNDYLIQKNQELDEIVRNDKKELEQLKNERDRLQKQMKEKDEELKQISNKNGELIEENHQLKFQQDKKINQQEYDECLKENRENIRKIFEMENEIQQLKQQLEITQMQIQKEDQNNENQPQTTDSSMSLIQQKNEEINELIQQVQQLNIKLKQKRKDSSMSNVDVIKDLEDGKILFEKKNQEIFQLRKENQQLQMEMVELKQKLEEYEQNYEKVESDAKEYQTIMKSVQIQPVQTFDFNTLLNEKDKDKRDQILSLKNKMEDMERNMIYLASNSELKREQIGPYKEQIEMQRLKIQDLEGENQELEILISQKQDLLLELEKQRDQYLENQNKMMIQGSIKGRPQIHQEKEILNENRHTCTGTQNDNCSIF